MPSGAPSPPSQSPAASAPQHSPVHTEPAADRKFPSASPDSTHLPQTTPSLPTPRPVQFPHPPSPPIFPSQSTAPTPPESPCSPVQSATPETLPARRQSVPPTSAPSSGPAPVSVKSQAIQEYEWKRHVQPRRLPR